MGLLHFSGNGGFFAEILRPQQAAGARHALFVLPHALDLQAPQQRGTDQPAQHPEQILMIQRHLLVVRPAHLQQQHGAVLLPHSGQKAGQTRQKFRVHPHLAPLQSGQGGGQRFHAQRLLRLRRDGPGGRLQPSEVLVGPHRVDGDALVFHQFLQHLHGLEKDLLGLGHVQFLRGAENFAEAVPAGHDLPPQFLIAAHRLLIQLAQHAEFFAQAAVFLLRKGQHVPAFAPHVAAHRTGGEIADKDHPVGRFVEQRQPAHVLAGVGGGKAKAFQPCGGDAPLHAVDGAQQHNVQ